MSIELGKFEDPFAKLGKLERDKLFEKHPFFLRRIVHRGYEGFIARDIEPRADKACEGGGELARDFGLCYRR